MWAGGKEDMPGRVGWESATLVPNLALALTSGKSLPVLPWASTPQLCKESVV